MSRILDDDDLAYSRWLCTRDALEAYKTHPLDDVRNGRDVEQLLDERGKTHGKFEVNAAVAQAVRDACRSHAEGWAQLTVVQREALDHIAGKVGRILAGKGGFKDHWDDIAGYAKLAANGGQP